MPNTACAMCSIFGVVVSKHYHAEDIDEDREDETALSAEDIDEDREDQTALS